MAKSVVFFDTEIGVDDKKIKEEFGGVIDWEYEIVK